MPQISFHSLAPSARVWVFGASASLDGAARELLLKSVDEHLANWRAHGVPLLCGRDWRDDRFLAIAVDEAATGASGCSIDGMFRVLATLQSELGASLVGGGTIFWRNADGVVQSGTRSEFVEAIGAGRVTGTTPVFDLTIDTVEKWRTVFERAADSSWHARMLKAAGVPTDG